MAAAAAHAVAQLFIPVSFALPPPLARIGSSRLNVPANKKKRVCNGNARANGKREQAIKDHKAVHVLSRPGQCDLTGAWPPLLGMPALDRHQYPPALQA